jgi:hypothetical protein
MASANPGNTDDEISQSLMSGTGKNGKNPTVPISPVFPGSQDKEKESANISEPPADAEEDEY